MPPGSECRSTRTCSGIRPNSSWPTTVRTPYSALPGRQGYLHGLTLFLAQVGVASGPQFFATVAAQGISLLLYGAVIALALVLITAALALWVFRLSFDTTAGVISGATGNPAILASAARVAPTDKPDVGYAMIFPSMTVAKILFVQIAATLLAG